MTTREFFRALEDDEFQTFQDLQEKVRVEFNRKLDQFPRHYSYLQLIDWARANKWIVSPNGEGYRFQVTNAAPVEDRVGVS